MADRWTSGFYCHFWSCCGFSLICYVSTTWVAWKFLCLDHRWQHYWQDFFS